MRTGAGGHPAADGSPHLPAFETSALRRFEVPGVTTLWRCASCGLFQYGPLVSAADYDDEYHVEYRRRESHKRRTALVRLHSVQSLLEQPTARLLDIGCSVGCTLAAAQQQGWEACGVDVSAAAVAHCREQGLAAVQADACELPFAAATFDIVTAWHVVEHVSDVRVAMREWHRVLRPGGILALETPDASYLKVRLWGRAYRKFWPPHHTYTFTRSTLQPFLERAGFCLARPSLGSRWESLFQQRGYAALRQAYHAARHWLGLRKDLLIPARKVRPSAEAALPRALSRPRAA